MNINCIHRCAFTEICRLDKHNTDECKVWSDYAAQAFHNSTIFGYPKEVFLGKQYKEKKDE